MLRAASRLFLFAFFALFALNSVAYSQDLPPEAKALLEAAERERVAIQKRAEAELAATQAKLIAQLKEVERALRLKGMNDAAARVVEAVNRLTGNAAPSGIVEVLWGGRWYAARILKEEKGRFYIHYENYGNEWDEWVGPDRLRKPAEPPTPRERDLKLEIQSGGAWYPGKILKKDEKTNRYYVLYHNNGIDWEEWVTPDRIKPMPK